MYSGKKACNNQHSKNKIRLPQSGKLVVAKVVHMISCLVQWGKPADDDIGDVVGFVRQFQDQLDGVRVHENPINAVHQDADDSRHLAEPQVAHQHDHDHNRGVAQHQEENGHHTLIGPAHFQGFYKSRDGDPLSCIGVAQDRCCGAPHIGKKRLLHRKKDGAEKDKNQVNQCGRQNVKNLSGNPGSSAGANQIQGGTGREKRHIRKQQNKQN